MPCIFEVRENLTEYITGSNPHLYSGPLRTVPRSKYRTLEGCVLAAQVLMSTARSMLHCGILGPYQTTATCIIPLPGEWAPRHTRNCSVEKSRHLTLPAFGTCACSKLSSVPIRPITRNGLEYGGGHDARFNRQNLRN